MSSHSLHLLNKVQALHEQVEYVKERYRAGPVFLDFDDPSPPVSLAHEFRLIFEKLLLERALPNRMTNTSAPESDIFVLSPNPRKDNT